MNTETIDIKNVPIKTIANIDELTEEINYISENEGIVVKNVEFPVSNFGLINIVDVGSTNIECGKIIDNIYLVTKQNNDNLIIICDFDKVEEVSENFCKSWVKLLLQTKSKIIPINMSIKVSTTISNFVISNFVSEEE